MRIYLDLDSRRLLTTPTRPLSLLEFKRRDNDSIELQFLRDAVVQQLPAGTTARVGIKPDGDYDAEFLAVSLLTQTGTGTATVYSGELNLNTIALEAAFAAEPVTLPAMLEVEWVTGDVVSSSKTLPATIHNDVIRGDEGTPVAIPSLKANQTEAEGGTDNTKWMTPLRTAQAIAALGSGGGGGGGVSSWNDLTDKPSTFPPATHDHDGRYYTETEADALLEGKQAAGSYATLVGGLVPSTQLPSYVDDVIEASSFATLPTGETGKIYVTLDSGKIYRWSGSAFIEISPSPGSTDAVPEGSSNLYFTTDRASAAAPVQSVAGKTGTVTLAKGDVGLSNVDNTSDLAKPISTATQTALNGKQAAGSYAPATGISPTAITGTAVITTDSRLADARSPLSHTHGNITNAGAIGTTASLPIITGVGGVLQAGSFGTTSGTFAAGDHTHSNFVVNGGSVATITRVTAMPATPVANTLYIVIP
jgi:hypothetical protein